TLLSPVQCTDIASRRDAHDAIKKDVDDAAVRRFLLQNLTRDDDHGFKWEPNMQMLLDHLDTTVGFPDVEGTFEDHPVLWIKGEHSDYINDASGAIMRELFPMTPRSQIRDAGHWIHAEPPKHLIETLNYHIASPSHDAR